MEVNTIQRLPKEQCTGCAACVNRCPADCIAMERDEEGFLYPSVDGRRCIGCGSCQAACPVLNRPERPDTGRQPDCYAAWSEDAAIRFHSTSGGIFTHLARAVLDRGGYVAGARYRGDRLVEHALISDGAGLEALRQSKYVQSETGLVYREVRERLEQGKLVLFAGTPCQCAGLRGFLHKEYDGLLLCDFICRGVNSPKAYLAYLRELEERYGSPVRQVWFKNKTYGWNRFCTRIEFEDGQTYLADREADPFMLGYIKSRLNLYARPSCYDCLFKGVSRPTDVTLGDFWGVEQQLPQIDTRYGVSLVLVHTDAGRALLDMIGGAEKYRVGLDAALGCNPCATRSIGKTTDRSRFFSELERKPFSASVLERI